MSKMIKIMKPPLGLGHSSHVFTQGDLGQLHNNLQDLRSCSLICRGFMWIHVDS